MMIRTPRCYKETYCYVKGCGRAALNNGNYCFIHAPTKIEIDDSCHEMDYLREIQIKKCLPMWTYFVHAPDVDLVKIGQSKNVKARLSELQVGSPVELILIEAIEFDEFLEPRLHKYFADERIRGEWFKNCEKLQGILKLANDLGGIGVSEFLHKRGIIDPVLVASEYEILNS